jgi:hypothetical protein
VPVRKNPSLVVEVLKYGELGEQFGSNLSEDTQTGSAASLMDAANRQLDVFFVHLGDQRLMLRDRIATNNAPE